MGESYLVFDVKPVLGAIAKSTVFPSAVKEALLKLFADNMPGNYNKAQGSPAQQVARAGAGDGGKSDAFT